jgi:hypothetical protein
MRSLIDRVAAVAEVFASIREDIVYTGGAVVQFLVSDPGAAPPRPTRDIDVFVTNSDRLRYYQAEAQLRNAKFTQRLTDEPICRWFRDDLIVDLMADSEDLLGFSNRWYSPGGALAEQFNCKGQQLAVLSAPYFLATKLEAFDSRGNGDYLASADLEDIVAVINGRASIADEIAHSAADVRDFLRTRTCELLRTEEFTDSLAGHLGGAQSESGRLEILRERLQAIAAIA